MHFSSALVAGRGQALGLWPGMLAFRCSTAAGLAARVQRLLRAADGPARCTLAQTRAFSAPPLLQPPSVEGDPIELNADCGLDLEASGVPTLAVIGPSRRGKSVLAGLLAGGDPGLFKQSHSSFRAMTSGTHVHEIRDAAVVGGPLRVIDTEGLSHVGRSRTKEALVRQFLISTYLTSSWVLWLDTEVLSSNFFTMMWLVHDYVVDVLKVRNAADTRLPRMMYVRTQETDVQRHEYCNEFASFSSFFDTVLETHEDAPILRQMFAPDGVHGHALPVWTMQDLESFEAGRFWSDGHTTPFKEAVAALRGTLLQPPGRAAGSEARPAPEGGREAEGGDLVNADGPPLMALGSLAQHLPRIARLEAFDPRDHEAMKVARLRAHLRASYGRVDPGGGNAEAVRLADIFDPEDRIVRSHAFRIDRCVETRLEEQCRLMRLEVDVARADPHVTAVLESFSPAAEIFARAVEAFLADEFREQQILRSAVQHWRLDPDVAAAEVRGALAGAEERFLAATGLSRAELKRLSMHERLVWRIDECVMRLRGLVATELPLREAKPQGGADPPSAIGKVWRLGRWQGAPPRDGKATRAKAQDFALWTDGTDWALYEERRDPARGADAWLGVLSERGRVAGPLPVP